MSLFRARPGTGYVSATVSVLPKTAALIDALVTRVQADGARRQGGPVLRDLLVSGLDWRTERADLRSALARCRASVNRGNYPEVIAIVDDALGGTDG